MQIKSFLKIRLLSINFEKFTSLNLTSEVKYEPSDQSQHFKCSTLIGPSVSL